MRKKQNSSKKALQKKCFRWRNRPKQDEKGGIRKKIVMTTTIIMIALALVLSVVMVGSMRHLTDTILLNTLKPMAKVSSQAVEANLHILGDRILTAADNAILSDPNSSPAKRKDVLKKMESGIEFVWIGLYDAKGTYIDGVNKCPNTLADEELFSLMERTQNLVIDDTRIRSDQLEIAIGTPILDQNGTPLYYLVGSYKYDVVNDVMSHINVGITGQAIMINDSGAIVAAQDKNLIQDHTLLSDHFSGNAEAQLLSDKMISGEIGSMTIGSGKQELLVSYAPVRGTHWSIAIYASRTDFRGIVDGSMFFALLLLLIAIIIAVILTSRFARSISRPLGKITKRLDGLAQGDLSTDIEIVQSKDETEILSLALQQTVHHINGYITELSKVLEELAQGNLDIHTDADFQGDFIAMRQSLDYITDSLSKIMSEIQSSARLLLETSQQVSSNAQMVDTSSAEQSNSVTRLAADANTISENITKVSIHTQSARSLMGTAKQRLDQEEELMHDLMDSIGQIHESFNHIAKINKFLEEIAFQTNLLALNASVEAARAGEAGKGFAVVAEEVRALASKTTQSAQAAAQIVDTSAKAVSAGSDVAKKTVDSMVEIASISEQVSQLTENLFASIEEEKLSLNQMLLEIESISKLADKNIDVSQQSSEASQKLTTQAQTLQSLAAQFHLKK